MKISVPTTGKLTCQLVDESGKAIPGVNVNLHDLFGGLKSDPVVIDKKVTNQNGLVDFGELNPATYYITADSPKVNNVAYIVKDYIQVRAGDKSQKTIKVTDYSGTISFTFASYYTDKPAKNIGILLIPFSKFTSQPISVMSKVAEFKGTTSSTGELSFRIPSDKSYMVLAYNLATERIYEYYMNFSVNTNENKSLYYGLPIW